MIRIHPAIVGLLVLFIIAMAGVYIMKGPFGYPVPEGYLVTNDSGALFIREKLIPTYLSIVSKDLKTSDGKKINDTLVPLLQELQMINNSPDRWSSKGTQEERSRSINTSFSEPINKVITEMKLKDIQPVPPFTYVKGNQVNVKDIIIETPKELGTLDGGLAASATNVQGELSPDLSTLLKMLEGTAATAGPHVNLGLTQLVGAGSGLSKNENSVYKPSQTIIAPHQIPPVEKKAITPIQPQGPAIPLLTPSLRQQIRNDIEEVVKDEISKAYSKEGFIGSKNTNEYEIQYS